MNRQKERLVRFTSSCPMWHPADGSCMAMGGSCRADEDYCQGIRNAYNMGWLDRAAQGWKVSGRNSRR